jgi:CheY-like chemotaxis protein
VFDRPTVLLVDDDPEIARAASLRLIAAGYHTLTAHNGQAAVASAVSSRPNAVVLDVRMPVQDGLATLADLKHRQDTKDIPVIMLSASIGDQQTALDAGARFFLRKPYRGEALVQAVNSAISAHRSETISECCDGSSLPAAGGTPMAEPGATPGRTESRGDRAMNHASPARPSSGTLRIPTVLCIDDDPDVSCAIEIYMRRYVVKVVRAFHGMHGFTEALRSQPDVIVMDLSMPNGDGCAILEILRRNRTTAATPVIILSGVRDQLQMRKMIALGANWFMRKPAPLEDLMREIERFVELRKRTEENGDSKKDNHA